MALGAEAGGTWGLSWIPWHSAGLLGALPWVLLREGRNLPWKNVLPRKGSLGADPEGEEHLGHMPVPTGMCPQPLF